MNGNDKLDIILSKLSTLDVLATEVIAIREDVNTLSSKVDAIEGRLDTIESRLDTIESRLDTLEGRFDTLEGRFDTLEGRFDTIEGRLDTLEGKVEILTDEVKSIKVIIENEIRVNIQRVAEGHLDLSRKLQDAIKSNNEFEMLTIRVSLLEKDVKELKTNKTIAV